NRIPNLSVSASEDAQGTVHITLANLSADTAYPIDCTLTGKTASAASARILTGAMDSFNDFGHADDVRVQDFDELTVEHGALAFTIPPCSVMEITVS
ncbi:MAG: alpha-L-arabinofuranosidase C-terminal domain-containing protein, partial [Hominenteromicrobium sp.]